MPRPKIYSNQITILFTEKDRAMLEDLAKDFDTPTISDVIRDLVRRAHEARKNQGSKNLPVSA
jgi:hypothetical protein